MNKNIFIMAAVLACATTAFANQKLAVEKNCMVCHGINSKIVGPAYADVAKRYAGKPTIVATLARKVLEGGGGIWGDIPMPPNEVTEAEATTLVKWVLEQK